MFNDNWDIELQELLKQKVALPKYRVLADAFEMAIQSGQLKRDDQLPTVRELSKHLNLSGTTVAAAFRILAQKGFTISKVGSGTRVAFGSERLGRAPTTTSRGADDIYTSRVALWRRRTQTNHISSLLKTFPYAKNYASGTPNSRLLPFEVMKRAWLSAASELTHDDLQYAGPAPITSLKRQLLVRLEADLVPALASDLIIGSSAQQLMTLAIQLVTALIQRPNFLVAVEEPGYPTLFDSYERMGHHLIGVEVDAEGAVPASVEKALAKGASAIVFTPRAHNPTGVSWSSSRRAELADVVADFPNTIIIEDDQFAEAANRRAGSLLQDRRLEDRVIYIRSFSKVIAPDLRLAAAVARPQIRALLMEGKFYTDGWSSTFSQKALAHAFADSELDSAITLARKTYNSRRHSFTESLLALSSGDDLTISPAADGVNVWIELCNGLSASNVAERAAAAGVLIATGEPFFVNVGRDDALRINTGMIADADIPEVSQKLVLAIKEAATSTPTLFSQHSL
jgi:GntR family transcriptional regulator/MocR family aminotransferase